MQTKYELYQKLYKIEQKYATENISCSHCEGLGNLFSKGGKEIKCFLCSGTGKSYRTFLENYKVSEKPFVIFKITIEDSGVSYEDYDEQPTDEDDLFTTSKSAHEECNRRNEFPTHYKGEWIGANTNKQ